MSAADDVVEAALQAFRDREPGRVSGVPGGTTLGQAAAVLGADPGRFGRWFLGTAQAEAFFCPADVGGHDGQVRIWFREDFVLKIQGEWPQMDVAAIDALGDPDDRLDFQMGVTVVEGGERVHAARGTAVQVNATGDLVVGWSIFPPTTAAAYRQQLWAPPEPHREAPAPSLGEGPQPGSPSHARDASGAVEGQGWRSRRSG